KFANIYLKTFFYIKKAGVAHRYKCNTRIRYKVSLTKKALLHYANYRYSIYRKLAIDM
ncbi:hypothetical protein C0J52_10338, partial [Blattella germanica]